jgi:NlpC/P60 family putative phage cell wall peptidase
MTLRERIVAEALTWQGTKFHDLAHVRGVGCDCGGLIIGVAKALGVLPAGYTPPAYSPTRHLHLHTDLMSAVLRECGCTVCPWEDRQPGDVVTFKFGHVVSHAAFLLPGDEMIHSVVDQGVCRHPLVGSWLVLHDRVWQFPGVTACP